MESLMVACKVDRSLRNVSSYLIIKFTEVDRSLETGKVDRKFPDRTKS